MSLSPIVGKHDVDTNETTQSVAVEVSASTLKLTRPYSGDPDRRVVKLAAAKVIAVIGHSFARSVPANQF